MNVSERTRTVNVVAAAAVELAVRIRVATEAAAGVTGAGPAALVMLLESIGGGTMDDVRHVVGLTPSGAVRLVDRLVASGLAARRPGADGRTVAVTLTAKGRRAAERVLAARARSVEAVVGALTAEQQAALADACALVLRAATADRMAVRRGRAEPAGGWLCRLCDFDACGRADGRCPAATAAAGETGEHRRPSIRGIDGAGA